MRFLGRQSLISQSTYTSFLLESAIYLRLSSYLFFWCLSLYFQAPHTLRIFYHGKTKPALCRQNPTLRPSHNPAWDWQGGWTQYEKCIDANEVMTDNGYGLHIRTFLSFPEIYYQLPRECSQIEELNWLRLANREETFGS